MRNRKAGGAILATCLLAFLAAQVTAQSQDGGAPALNLPKPLPVQGLTANPAQASANGLPAQSLANAPPAAFQLSTDANNPGVVGPTLSQHASAGQPQSNQQSNQPLSGCYNWKPPTVSMPTPWTHNIDWNNLYPEYPRPKMVRAEGSWLNLNGLWEFQPTSTFSDPPVGVPLPGCIAVPFPMESELSGIGQHYNASWYRRTFTLPSGWDATKQRILLQSTRVDWRAGYYVDGQLVGNHTGGYAAHTLDITYALSSAEEHELIVGVLDMTELGPNQPLGKQRSFSHGGDRIVYTSVSGIWGSVWLEAVPLENAILDAEAFGDLDTTSVRVLVRTSGLQQTNLTTIQMYFNGQPVKTLPLQYTYLAGGGPQPDYSGYNLRLDEPVKLWSADEPNLYMLNVSIAEGDYVQIWAGFNKAAKANSTSGQVGLRLNNAGTGTFLSGPLYQGYFPDGLYAMATAAQARDVVASIKSFGFNAVRVHGKVEHPYFYEAADTLGLYVIQDIPSPCGLDPTGAVDGGPPVSLTYYSCWNVDKNRDWNDASRASFQAEVAEIVAETRSHPSIVSYVAYNEGWGEEPQQVAGTVDLISTTAAFGPGKLVDEASGWVYHGNGDFTDIHQYMDAADFAKNADPTAVSNTFGFKPDITQFRAQQPDASEQFTTFKVPFIGEFGGVGRYINGSIWNNLSLTDPRVCVYGCDIVISAQEVTDRILAQLDVVATRAAQGKAAGSIYTQLNDVENELNGLFTYDFQQTKLVARDALAAKLGQTYANYAAAVTFA